MEQEEARAGCVWLSLSLLRLDKEEDLVNCRPVFITTSSQPMSHRRQSQGLVRRLQQPTTDGVGFPPELGDPLVRKPWDSKTQLICLSILTGCSVFYRAFKVVLNFMF